MIAKRETHEKRHEIPVEVSRITETLEKAGFETYLVGGCVRDLVVGKKPKDWDVTTNARPEDIQKLFENTFYENDFGTVGVVNETEDETLKVVEITPYRLEGKYTDKRRPDGITFADNLEDDLKRRDFTVNAMAYSVSLGHIVDLYQGHDDIKDKTIRTVGDPTERFMEDSLRLLRAVRFASELGFTINKETADAIYKEAGALKGVSAERIRDEFSKIVDSPRPLEGIVLTERLGLLKYILPELEEGIKTEQNGDHIYDVWEHNLRALQHASDRGWPFHVKLSALLHDVAKPATRRWSEEKKDWTFYGHDVVGGRMATKALTRLKFPKKTIDTVATLVRYHLFFSDVEKITLSAVRRIVKNVGPELVWDLMKVRACDRIGMGRPKETPYRLRKYESMIEEAMRAPVSVGMLKIDGAKIMELTGGVPGPRVGWILHALLEEALDTPDINTVEQLETHTLELAKLPDAELKVLGEKGRERKDQVEEEEVSEIRKRHWVK